MRKGSCFAPQQRTNSRYVSPTRFVDCPESRVFKNPWHQRPQDSEAAPLLTHFHLITKSLQLQPKISEPLTSNIMQWITRTPYQKQQYESLMGSPPWWNQGARLTVKGDVMVLKNCRQEELHSANSLSASLLRRIRKSYSNRPIMGMYLIRDCLCCSNQIVRNDMEIV